MDGWTEVRYGRRAKRDRAPYRDRDYGWSDGRKESAPSFSFGRRDRFPFPNPHPCSYTTYRSPTTDRLTQVNLG